jgi:large subunit ribosomal protein L13
MTNTVSARKEGVQRKWHLVDGEGVTLGKLAVRVATLLRGKHKPIFTPHVDTGDFVIVVNADKVVLTGDKWAKKTYYHHTGWPGGLRSTTAGKLRREKPERLVEYAVSGMLPKTKLGKAMFRKLKVYAGGKHPHQAQRPEALDFRNAKF